MQRTAAEHTTGGWHYVVFADGGGHAIGYCAEHPTHPTQDEARRCYRLWQRAHVELREAYSANWGDCAVAECPQPTKSGAVITGDGYAGAWLCAAHLTHDHAIVALGLDADLAGDSWES